MTRGMAAVTAALVLACGDGAGPDGDRTVSLSITGGGTPSLAIAAGDTVVLGGNTLVLDRVQVVLREIELDRVNDDACDSISGEDDRCQTFATGPVLLDLPLDGSITTVLSMVVDTGTYGELEFAIHKPDDDTAADLAFLADHPEFTRVSIRAQGTFNGTPFIYETDLNVDQEVDLVPPLVITEFNAPTNLTLRVDVRTWFVVNGALINPASANKGGINEGAVKDNVKDSFEAYEDDDHDGDD